MKYFKQFMKVLLYPIIFLVGQFLIQLVFVFQYNQAQIKILKNQYHSLSTTQINHKFNDLIKTVAYKEELNNYINSKALIIIIIIGLIFIPIFLTIYKKYKNNDSSSMTLNSIPIIIILGICVSLIFNLTMSNVNNIYHFTNNYKLSSIPIWVQIISSGIIGPVLEELLFRGIGYNQLKKFNTPMKAIIISSIIFALFHFSNILNLVYAFMMSFLFIYLYEKYRTLKAPIILHMSANITTILSMLFIVNNNTWINLLVILWSLSILIVLYLCFIKKDMIKY